MDKWHLIENHPLLSTIYREPPLISYRRGKSLKDILVRAKLWRSRYYYIAKQRESRLACQPFLAAVCNSSDVCPSVFHKIKKGNELSLKTYIYDQRLNVYFRNLVFVSTPKIGKQNVDTFRSLSFLSFIFRSLLLPNIPSFSFTLSYLLLI